MPITIVPHTKDVSMTIKAFERTSESRLERKRQINRLSAQRKRCREKNTMRLLSERYNELVLNKRMLELERDKLKHLMFLLAKKPPTEQENKDTNVDKTSKSMSFDDYVASGLHDLSNCGKDITSTKKTREEIITAFNSKDADVRLAERLRRQNSSQTDKSSSTCMEMCHVIDQKTHQVDRNDVPRPYSSTMMVNAVEGQFLKIGNRIGNDATSKVTVENGAKTSPPSLENSSCSNTSLSSVSTSGHDAKSYDHTQLISNMVLLQQNDKETRGMIRCEPSLPSSNNEPSKSIHPYHLYFSKLGKASDDIRSPDEVVTVTHQNLITMVETQNNYSTLHQNPIKHNTKENDFACSMEETARSNPMLNLHNKFHPATLLAFIGQLTSQQPSTAKLFLASMLNSAAAKSCATASKAVPINHQGLYQDFPPQSDTVAIPVTGPAPPIVNTSFNPMIPMVTPLQPPPGPKEITLSCQQTNSDKNIGSPEQVQLQLLSALILQQVAASIVSST